MALALVGAGIVGLAGYCSAFVVSYDRLFHVNQPLVVTDVARLTHARVARIENVATVDEIRSALLDAVRDGYRISIAGARHSQGGHTNSDNVVVLDMSGFHDVRSIDLATMTITVESGATWDDIQRVLAPQRLALKVMQSSNVFSVGGSLSANAHGRDIDVSQIVDVVERFSLMLADGSIVNVSRETQPELFSLVIGGYGLYGVILDVTLHVVRDELYEQHSEIVDYADFPSYVTNVVLADPGSRMMIARPSVSPDIETFLREMVVVTWSETTLSSGTFDLTEEQNVLRDRFIFSLSRRFDWAKSLRWSLQLRHEPTLADSVVVSRNNAMRPPTAPFRFLDYYSNSDSDILQEYFLPMDEFAPFMDEVREILETNDANLLSSTVRLVSPEPSPELAYAPSEWSIAVVLLLNVGLETREQAMTERMTRQLVEAALRHGGKYYLTYQLYPTADQLLRAYPRAARAFERKRFYDPSETFTNRFYEQYRDALAEM